MRPIYFVKLLVLTSISFGAYAQEQDPVADKPSSSPAPSTYFFESRFQSIDSDVMDTQLTTPSSLLYKRKKTSGLLYERSDSLTSHTRMPSFRKSAFEEANFFNCTVKSSDFMKLAKKFDTSSCFPLSSFDNILESYRTLRPIEKDMQVCSCLDRKSDENTMLRIMMKSNEVIFTPKDKEEATLKTYEENFKKAWNKVEAARLSIALDASIIYEGNPEVTAHLTNDGSKLQKIKESLAQAAGFNKNNRLITEAKKIQERVTVSKELDLLTGKEDIILNQCVSPREFLAYRQLPKDPSLLSSFEKAFVAEEWDFNKVRNKYKEYMALEMNVRSKYAPEITQLKEKLLFLSRNPMIKLVMGSSDIDSKRSLYGILKEYTGACGANSVCPIPVEQVNADNIYRKKLQEFFANKKNREVLTEEADKQWANDTKAASSNDKLFINKLDSENREEMRSNFLTATGMDPDSCDVGTPTFDNLKCLETYVGYCARVKHNYKKLSAEPMIEEVFKDNIDFLIEEESRLDFENNKGFKEFNDTICNQTYEFRNSKQGAISFTAYKKNACNGMDVVACRKKFSNDPELVIPDAFNDFVTFIENNPVTNMSITEASTVANASSTGKKGSRRSREKAFESYANQNIPSYGSRTKSVASTSSSNNSVKPQTQESASSASPINPYWQEPTASSYVANYGPTNTKTAKEEKTNIQDLPRNDQENLLNDWKKELSDIRNDKEATNTKNTASASEKLLQDRIEALEILLRQQKELSDKQYAMLNDALKEKETASQVASAEKEEAEKRKVASSGLASQRDEFVEQQHMNRAPASVKGTGGFHAGGGFGSESSGARAGVTTAAASAAAMKEATNREALAREEAKLINLRQETGGAITIEGVKGTSATGANAIAVNITDDFYKQVRVNPVGLNLKQIEASIPKDQIALLEKQGVITLILQNGKNPPVEVKVTKRNGSLVQVENTSAVVRRVSLQSLQNTFRE